MIAVLKKTATKDQIESLKGWFENKGLKVNESQGEFCTVLGLIGDTTQVDIEMLMGLDIIETVTRVSEPFKKANRKFHPEDTVVDCGGVKIGGGHFAVMAGPCSVESREQIIETAKRVQDAGATLSPKTFCGPETTKQFMPADQLLCWLISRKSARLSV